MSRSQFASPHHQQQGGYHPQAGGNGQPEQSPFGGALFARSTATPMPPAEHSGGQVCCCLSSLTSDAESRLCDRQHFTQPFLCHHLVFLFVGHTLHIEPHSPSRPLPLSRSSAILNWSQHSLFVPCRPPCHRRLWLCAPNSYPCRWPCYAMKRGVI
jgi:hypothetical protein